MTPQALTPEEEQAKAEWEFAQAHKIAAQQPAATPTAGPEFANGLRQPAPKPQTDPGELSDIGGSVMRGAANLYDAPNNLLRLGVTALGGGGLYGAADEAKKQGMPTSMKDAVDASIPKSMAPVGSARDFLNDAVETGVPAYLSGGSSLMGAAGIGAASSAVGQATNAVGMGKGPGQLIGGLTAGTLENVNWGKAAKSFAETMADPQAQAALQFARARGLLDTPTAQKALQNEQMTPEIWNAMQASQKYANSSAPVAGAVKDELIPNAMGYPEASGQRAFAASETAAGHGPEIIRSNIFTGGSQYNPETGVFEGQPQGIKTVKQIEVEASTAAQLAMEARTQKLGTLDTIVNDLNRNTPGEPVIRGLTFDSDVATRLGSLRDLGAKRSLDSITEPISKEFQTTYDNLQSDFEAFNNSTQLFPFLRVSPSGSYQAGELMPSQVNSVLENINAYSRSLGKFDEAVKASGLNSTFSEQTGRDAQLYALGEAHKAITAAFEQKIGEIAQKGQELARNGITIGGQTYGVPWAQEAQGITPDSISNMNKSYAAMKNLAEQATTQQFVIGRGNANPNSNSLISSTQNNPGVGDQIMAAKADPVRSLLNMFSRPDPTSANLPLTRFMANQDAPTDAANMVASALQMRGQPSPIMSRNWDAVKGDKFQWANFAQNAAVITGADINKMPEEVQKQIFRQVLANNPQAQAPIGGYSSQVTVDGKNQVEGIDKDYAMMNASRIDNPADRAKAMSGLFKDGTLPDTIQANKAPIPAVDPAKALGFLQSQAISEPPKENLSLEPMNLQTESDKMLDMLHKAQELHGTQ